MINPRLLEIWKQKLIRRSSGKKYYRAGFSIGNYSKVSHKRHWTATEAMDYGERVKVRWCRLYDAAILEAAKAGISAGTSL